MAVQIPIFLSKPSKLSVQQEQVLRYVRSALDQENLIPRTLGQSDFPQSNPIAEAAHLARACYGGLILGFATIETPPGFFRNVKPADIARAEAQARPRTFAGPRPPVKRTMTPAAKGGQRSNRQVKKLWTGDEPLLFPTPWNHIEAGMLIAFRKPLLVFAEKGISGGIFDKGAFAGFMQEFEMGPLSKREREVIRERVRLWSAEVRIAFRG